MVWAVADMGTEDATRPVPIEPAVGSAPGNLDHEVSVGVDQLPHRLLRSLWGELELPDHGGEAAHAATSSSRPSAFAMRSISLYAMSWQPTMMEPSRRIFVRR